MKGMVAIYRAQSLSEASLSGGNGEPGFKFIVLEKQET